MTVSYHLPFLRPEMMPKTTPKIASNTNAVGQDRMVTGKARAISSRTGCPAKVSRGVQGQCICQVDKVLNDERLVEMVFCADLGCDGLIDGLVPEHGLDGVARQGEDKGMSKYRAEATGIICRMRRQKFFHTVAPYFLDRPERAWLSTPPPVDKYSDILPHARTVICKFALTQGLRVSNAGGYVHGCGRIVDTLAPLAGASTLTQRKGRGSCGPHPPCRTT